MCYQARGVCRCWMLWLDFFVGMLCGVFIGLLYLSVSVLVLWIGFSTDMCVLKIWHWWMFVTPFVQYALLVGCVVVLCFSVVCVLCVCLFSAFWLCFRVFCFGFPVLFVLFFFVFFLFCGDSRDLPSSLQHLFSSLPVSIACYLVWFFVVCLVVAVAFDVLLCTV